MRTFLAAPSAAMLIESMRDIGYALETALADVIDNSITADATQIDIYTDSGGKHRVAILDNGTGMTWEDLMVAMRPGCRNPLDERSAADLGRFGLGLKTASFSQCRRLTVVTRRRGETHAAVWDLEFVSNKDEWLVQIPDEVTDIPWIDQLGSNGTLVLWEDLDRLVEECDGVPSAEHFDGRLADALSHLELVFHRFLSGEAGTRRVSISLNNRSLVPHDPFHSRHTATVIGPKENIKVGDHWVTVQTFTLPHHRKVSADEWDRLAGREGYLKNQGFYVYRQKRLIIYGTWFGLARQTELTKLARVRIDMPNGLDEEWKIDVKKASAQPPFVVRERLRRIIETIGATSKRIYTTRGHRRATDDRLPVWNRIQDKNEIRYAINRDHPVVEDFVAALSNENSGKFIRILELFESTLPMDMFFADMGGAPDLVRENAASDDTLRHTILTTVERLQEKGVTEMNLRDLLQHAEPFKTNWDRVLVILEELGIKGGK
ncbi:MAG TPA: ATP-binding protein [Phycisphaerae bacterium]|nr:ATP-binding protein [Phycisphaerae bacterium]HRW54515.1 ATP-binding protein [Phycisphaerae bacterium]